MAKRAGGAHPSHSTKWAIETRNRLHVGVDEFLCHGCGFLLIEGIYLCLKR
ncbi:MAG: hypothetical protein N2035_09970 [Chthoniobacterales bacterium]|nr:hypothetical protein [Chthoniobacterales bacterium]